MIKKLILNILLISLDITFQNLEINLDSCAKQQRWYAICEHYYTESLAYEGRFDQGYSFLPVILYLFCA